MKKESGRTYTKWESTPIIFPATSLFIKNFYYPQETPVHRHK